MGRRETCVAQNVAAQRSNDQFLSKQTAAFFLIITRDTRRLRWQRERDAESKSRDFRALANGTLIAEAQPIRCA